MLPQALAWRTVSDSYLEGEGEGEVSLSYRRFLRWCKVGVLQYTVIEIITTLLAL